MPATVGLPEQLGSLSKRDVQFNGVSGNAASLFPMRYAQPDARIQVGAAMKETTWQDYRQAYRAP